MIRNLIRTILASAALLTMMYGHPHTAGMGKVSTITHVRSASVTVTSDVFRTSLAWTADERNNTPTYALNALAYCHAYTYGTHARTACNRVAWKVAGRYPASVWEFAEWTSCYGWGFTPAQIIDCRGWTFNDITSTMLINSWSWDNGLYVVNGRAYGWWL